jgi:hypothetical protein
MAKFYQPGSIEKLVSQNVFKIKPEFCMVQNRRQSQSAFDHIVISTTVLFDAEKHEFLPQCNYLVVGSCQLMHRQRVEKIKMRIA